MEESRVNGQVIEGLTVDMEVLDIANVKSKVSKNFHGILFTFGWFEIFQISYSFCDCLENFWGYNVTRKPNFVFLDEWIKMNRRQLAEEVWKFARAIKST